MGEFSSDACRSSDVVGFSRGTSSRGKDAVGFWSDHSVWLSASRFSVIDISGSAQPVVSTDGQWVLIANAEIYNAEELRVHEAEAGFNFVTNGDIEVITAVFARLGYAGLERLRGVFAFALYNTVRRELYLGRDRWGEKPLFYSRSDGCVRFSSEIRLLMECMSGEFCPSFEHLALWLACGTCGEESTLFCDIKQIAPGAVYKFERQSEVKVLHYVPSQESCSAGGTFDDHFRNAVKRCATSDVPIALAFSGGLDSSCVALQLQRCEKPFVAYVLFDPTMGHDDPNLIRASWAASKLGIECIPIPYSICNIDKDLIEIIEVFDTPVSDPIAFHNHYFNKEVGKYHKVLLGGHGADEILGGYPRYEEILARLGCASMNVRDFLGSCFKQGISWRRLQEFGLTCEIIYDFKDKGIKILEQISRVTEAGHPGLLARLMDFFVFYRSLNFVITDECSYINNVEVRSPFFDYDLVHWAFSAEDQALFGPFGGKQPLRELLGKSSLKELVTQEKIGFNYSYNYMSWLQRPSSTVQELNDVGSCWIQRYFGRDAANQVESLSSRSPIVRWRTCALGGWLLKQSIT